MSSFRKMIIEEARLVMLRLLSEQAEYQSNSSILDRALDEFGLNLSRDQVDSELAWLAEQGLVTTDRVLSITRATLTLRGLDVAQGQASVPGVKRPSPKA
ncbi:MAG: ArsR family transcriptional regulator [Nevskia sp.]|jgi:DNA-binding transcriptional ArsR family regulator|nr:ArsR family transcriptional regulator [Nevskia sp.]